MIYDTDPSLFAAQWMEQQINLQQRIAAARTALPSVRSSTAMLNHISTIVCEHGVLSLRADLAIARASQAQAALLGCDEVTEEHIDAVLPLALAHRMARSPEKPPIPKTSPSRLPEAPMQSKESYQTDEMTERRFSSMSVSTPELRWIVDDGESGATEARKGKAPGPVVRSRKSEQPAEVDARSSVLEAVVRTGQATPRLQDLYERVREPLVGSRFLFVVDSSGSHAARERMRAVKGAVAGLMERSLRRRDEIAVVVFRGESAEVLVEPTSDVSAVTAALEYLPTGGRTPLAHALELASGFVTTETLLVLITDGRANVPYGGTDAWQDALQAAIKIQCPALVVDTESSENAFGKARELADAMGAECISLTELEAGYDFAILLKSGARR
jgi:magnesium chelatase subunit D